MKSREKGKGKSKGGGVARKRKPGAGRKASQFKRASVVGLPRRDAHNLLNFGATGEQALVRDFILLEQRYQHEALEAFEGWAGPDATALRRITRDFLGEWLARAAPSEIRALAAWKNTIERLPQSQPKVTDWLGLLTDMPRQKQALVDAAGNCCTSQTLFDDGGHVVGVLWRKPDGVAEEDFKPIGFEHYSTYLARQKTEDILKYLEENGVKVTRDALSKGLQSLGTKRPPGRPPRNGTFL